MEPPWILVICHEFPPIGGGAGQNLSLLCRELSRRGYRVKVWTADPGAGNRLPHDAEAVEVAYIQAGRRGRFETRLRGMLVFALKAALKAWGLRKSGRPALVLSCLGIPAGLAGTAASRRLGVPHAVWYHGSDVHGGRPEGCGALQRFLIRRVAAAAAHNLFISAGLRDMALAFAAAPGAAILPSCPAPEISAAAETGAALPAGAGYFLFLGRLEPVKNPLLAVQAIALLQAEGKTPPPLRMVGGGRLRSELEEALRRLAPAGRAALEPPAPHAEVPGLLRGALALIVPSRVEGFNTTLLEAARFGVPTVGSDVVGVRDFVRDGETGLLFPEGDAAALARALERIAADRPLRDALGSRARAASRPFRPDRVADLFLDAVGSALPAPPAPSASSVRSDTPPEETPACP